MGVGGGGSVAHWRQAVEGRVGHGGVTGRRPQRTHVTTVTTLYSRCTWGSAGSRAE